MESFDKKKLEALLDDPDTLVEIVKEFVSQIPSQLQDLKKSMAEKNLSKTQTIAHTLKGMCANFFSEKPQKIAQALEEEAKAKILSPHLGDQLEHALIKLSEDLKKSYL